MNEKVLGMIKVRSERGMIVAFLHTEDGNIIFLASINKKLADKIPNVYGDFLEYCKNIVNDIAKQVNIDSTKIEWVKQEGIH